MTLFESSRARGALRRGFSSGITSGPQSSEALLSVFVQQTQHIAQLALQRQRAFAALLTAGNGHVVETLARLRQKKCVWIAESKLAPDRSVGNDETIAQLGQDHLQRFPESIED